MREVKTYFFRGDEAGDGLAHLRMQRRLAAGNRDHRSAALVDRSERQSSATRRFFLRISARYWIFPQPARARLQRNSKLEHQDEGNVSHRETAG